MRCPTTLGGPTRRRCCCWRVRMDGCRWAWVLSRPGDAAAAEKDGLVDQGWGVPSCAALLSRLPPALCCHSGGMFIGYSPVPCQCAPPPAPLPRLFPGIEKYGESWQQVAEHVGGRSAMQCVARFLQLPTEEALAADATPGPTSHGLVRKGRGRQRGRGAGAWVCREGFVLLLDC